MILAVEELQEPVIPDVWRHCPPISFDVNVLHAYKISFHSVLHDREYANFALLMKSYLPQKAAHLAETFQLRQGNAVFCKVEALKDVCLNPVQVAQAEQFQSALFSVLLDRNFELSQFKDQLAYGPWYLLLPLKKDQQLRFSEDQDIDWERISKLKLIGDLKSTINVAENPGPKVDGTPLQFANGVLNKENVPGLLVRPIYSKTHYCIIDIFKDLHAESPFPNNRHKNYVEYFRSTYKCELVLRGQNLLKARCLRDARNFLLDRSKKQGVTDFPSIRCNDNEIEHSSEARKLMEKPERSIVELPPEICIIECSGFYDDFVNAAVILPSVMHRIESILVAAQFHMLLSSKFAEGSLVSVEKVLEATTTKKCVDHFSLERLELLGDSFLKYAISCNLFLAYEEADEGFLSMQRSEKVCNSTLFTLGKKIGIIVWPQDFLTAICYTLLLRCHFGLLKTFNITFEEVSALKELKEEGVIQEVDKMAIKEEITKELTKAMEVKMEATEEGWVDVVRSKIKREVKEEKQHEETLWMHATLECAASFTCPMQARQFSKIAFGDCKILVEEYIRDSFFDPKDWIADCHPSKVACDIENIEVLHGKSSKDIEGGHPFVICNKRHRWMQRKTVADAIEALIGAYLEDGGEYAALAFMKFVGMDVVINTLQIEKVQSLSKNNLSLLKKIDIKAIESLLSYSFEHKGLLIEAFIHASFSNHLGKCYQRLEFLGDSVLDFLITQHLYREYKNSQPGELTDLRSTIVSNNSFARIVIERGLYSHLLENSVELSRCIKEFIISQSGRAGDWEGVKCPKALGDILESLSGAILVDGGFELSVVWRVFEPILQPLISAHEIQINPVRELLELCQHKQVAWKENLDKSDKQIQCTFEVHLDNHAIEGSAICKDTTSAKRQAAVDVLAKLKGLGYVHRSRSNMECTLSKEPLVNAERCDVLESIGNSSTADIWSQPWLQNAGTNTDVSQDCMGLKNVPETKAKQPVMIDSSEATKLETEPKQTLMTMTNSDGSCKGSEQDSFWSYVRSGDTANAGPSQGALNVQYSAVVLSGAECLGLEKLKDGNVGNFVEQSSTAVPARSPKLSWLDEGHDPCAEKVFNVCPQDTVANLASPTVSTSRGRPRADLYEACARKKWEHPLFTCSNKEGPPHDKCFTYQVVLQLPHVGQVHCTGDSRRTTKAAMDSAAEELLNWLKTLGYL
ncbi:hypothetical protein L7F22_047489 [Adiantum nelumboides]|nr:hypothetical protein [Adiantum nelumboides]